MTKAVTYEFGVNGIVDDRFEFSIGQGVGNTVIIKVIDNYDRTLIFKEAVKYDGNKTRQSIDTTFGFYDTEGDEEE